MAVTTDRSDNNNAERVVARLMLFTIVGITGWMLGGTFGGFAGAGLDIVFIGAQAPEPGIAVAPFMWTVGWLGAIGGMVGSMTWLANEMRRRAL